MKIYCLFLLLISIVSIYCEFSIESPDFRNESMLDKKFTPFGEDVNPKLKWTNVPEGTKSFALICEDPDCPSGLFTHWAVKNIPKDITQIGNGEKIGEEITNSWGIKRYKGPRPPSGTHRYYFKLYALSVESLNAKNIKELRKQIIRNKIGEAFIMGKFSKE